MDSWEVVRDAAHFSFKNDKTTKGLICERESDGRKSQKKTYKDKIAERKRVREKRRARIERGTMDVPEESGIENDEQLAVRHSDASGCHILVGRRGSEATGEKPPDKLKKTARFEQEVSSASASSDPCVVPHSPRAKTGTYEGPCLQKHHQNSTRRYPQRDKKKAKMEWETEKSAKFGPSAHTHHTHFTHHTHHTHFTHHTLALALP